MKFKKEFGLRRLNAAYTARNDLYAHGKLKTSRITVETKKFGQELTAQSWRELIWLSTLSWHEL